MEWTVQDLGALGEFIGAVTVIATLLYLAVQVRHARAEMQRALSQGRLDSNRELVALEMDELNLAAFLKANVALDWEAGPMLKQLMEKCGLNLEEAYRVWRAETAWWNYRVYGITHFDELDPKERQGFDRATRNRYSSGVSRWIYESVLKPNAHPDVVRYIDAVVLDPPAS